MSIIILNFLLLNELEKSVMLDSIESNLKHCYFKGSFSENNGIIKRFIRLVKMMLFNLLGS